MSEKTLEKRKEAIANRNKKVLTAAKQKRLAATKVKK